jgi:hypothetical protein
MQTIVINRKKILNVTTVKLFSKIKIHCFGGFSYPNLFQPLIKAKYFYLSEPLVRAKLKKQFAMTDPVCEP